MIRERKGTKIGEKLKVVYFCFAAKWIDSKGLYFFSKHQDACAIQFRSLKVMPGFYFPTFPAILDLKFQRFSSITRTFFFLTVGQNNFGFKKPFLFSGLESRLILRLYCLKYLIKQAICYLSNFRIYEFPNIT